MKLSMLASVESRVKRSHAVCSAGSSAAGSRSSPSCESFHPNRRGGCRVRCRSRDIVGSCREISCSRLFTCLALTGSLLTSLSARFRGRARVQGPEGQRRAHLRPARSDSTQLRTDDPIERLLFTVENPQRQVQILLDSVNEGTTIGCITTRRAVLAPRSMTATRL